jgi:hypothetical protein
VVGVCDHIHVSDAGRGEIDVISLDNSERIIQKNVEGVVIPLGEHGQHRAESEALKRELRGSGDLERILYEFGAYVDRVRRVGYVVGRSRWGNEIRYVKAINRYQREYWAMVKEKLKGLPKSNGVFLTLTFEPEKLGYDVEKAWEMLGREWNRFLTALRYAVGKKQLSYIRVVEVHHSGEHKGWPHIHVFFFYIDYLLPNGSWKQYKKGIKALKGTLEGLWKWGFTYVEAVKNGYVRDPRGKRYSVVNYVLKYLRKGMDVKALEDMRSDNPYYIGMAYMWLYNVRSYSTSRDIGKIMKESYAKFQREARRKAIRENPEILKRAVFYEWLEIEAKRGNIPIKSYCPRCGVHWDGWVDRCPQCDGRVVYVQYTIPLELSERVGEGVDVGHVKAMLVENGLYYYDRVVWDKIIMLSGEGLPVSVDEFVAMLERGEIMLVDGGEYGSPKMVG